MTTMDLNIKKAIAQFGMLDDKVILKVAEMADDCHWYVFDETADKEFELKQLCDNYDIVLLCEGATKFTEVKNEKNI